MIEKLKKLWLAIWPAGLILLVLWTLWCNYTFTQAYYQQALYMKAQQIIQQAQAQQQAQQQSQQRQMQQQMMGNVNRPAPTPEKPPETGGK